MRVWMCVNVKEEPKCNFFMCCSCVLSTWMWIATRVASHFDIENTVLSLLFCVHRTPNPIALKCVFAPSFGPSFISPQRTCFFMCACCLIKYFWARLTYFTFKFLLRWTYRISREFFFWFCFENLLGFLCNLIGYILEWSVLLGCPWINTHPNHRGVIVAQVKDKTKPKTKFARWTTENLLFILAKYRDEKKVENTKYTIRTD